DTVVPWTGLVTTGGLPWRATFGRLRDQIGSAPASNVALIGLGAPDFASGLSTEAPTDPIKLTRVSTTLSYTFGAALPANAQFFLWSPGGWACTHVGQPDEKCEDGPYTFQLSAAYRGAPISRTGWSVKLVGPVNKPAIASYNFKQATGTLTV